MSQANPRRIHEIIKQNKLTIKKRFGQNFLIDQNILKRIVLESEINKETIVIEIGPGLGSLTEVLLEKAKAVLAYEIDRDLIPILRRTFNEESFYLIEDDFLKRNIDNDLKTYFPNETQFVVVANLPYYITTPILMKCLEETKKIERLIVMTQLEVAKRLTATHNTKDYNALTLAVAYRGDAKFSFKVPRTVFIPSPEVDSAVIRVDVKKERALSSDLETYFFALIRIAFRQRRKTLLNNLASATKVDKTSLERLLVSLAIPVNARAESLNMEQFLKLTEGLHPTKLQ